MYKKSADLIHLHARTASHATKGSGRGTVWWRTADSENYNPGAHRKELNSARRHIFKQYGIAAAEFKKLLEMTADAVSRRDQATILALRPSIRRFSKNLKKMRKEIARIDSEIRLTKTKSADSDNTSS